MYIGEKETKWLLTILITSQIFVNGINIFTKAAGTSAAFVAFLSFAIVFAYVFFIERIKISEDIGIFGMMSECYGKLTVFVGLVFSALSLLNSSMKLKMFTTAVTDIILPDSPQIFVLIFFVIAMLAVSFSGLAAVTRYALPAGIGILLFSFLICIFNLEGFKIVNIFPVLGRGNKGIALSAGSVRLFADIFYVFVLSDFFRQRGALKRVALKTMALSGAIIVLLTLFYTLAVPYPASSGFEYPFFRLSSLANTSVLFQRLDAAVYIIWIFSGFLSVGITTLLTSIIFAKSFGLTDYKGVIHALTFVIAALSLAKGNYFDLVNSLFAIFVFSLIGVTAVIYRFKIISGRDKNEN